MLNLLWRLIIAELFIGIFAVLKAGAAYIPMDPEYPADRLMIMAEDSEVGHSQSDLVAFHPAAFMQTGKAWQTVGRPIVRATCVVWILSHCTDQRPDFSQPYTPLTLNYDTSLFDCKAEHVLVCLFEGHVWLGH